MTEEKLNIRELKRIVKLFDITKVEKALAKESLKMEKALEEFLRKRRR